MPAWSHRAANRSPRRSAPQTPVVITIGWSGHNAVMPDPSDPAFSRPATPDDSVPTGGASVPTGGSGPTGGASGGGADDAVDAFDRLVLAAVEGLPAEFRERLGSVAIVVEDEPTAAQLASVRAYGLLGLYSGVPRTVWGADGAPAPSKITIFRLPHLRRYRTPESLERGVAETVRHEVAHHFGISDARLEELARASRARHAGR